VPARPVKAPDRLRALNGLPMSHGAMASDPGAKEFFEGSEATQVRPQGMSVVVGRADGTSINGRAGWFEPAEPDLVIEMTGRAISGRPNLVRIAAEDITYVGIAKGSGSRLDDPANRPAGTPLKVTVPGGKSFLVIPSDVGSTRLGFYAVPNDPASPFAAVYFYNRAINAKESVEPLGSLLLKSGAVSPEDLQRGLAAQEDGRKTPIGKILVEQRRVPVDAVERAAQLQARRGMRIGEILVQEGLANTQDVEAALAEQRKRKGRKLGELLVEMKIITEEVLTRTLARKFHIPFANLDRCEVNLAVARELPCDLMEKYRVLLLQLEERVATVAISDPIAVDVIDALRFALRRDIQEVLVNPSQLEKYVSKLLPEFKRDEDRKKMGSILKDLSVDEIQTAKEIFPDEVTTTEADSAVIRLANQIIVEAVRRGASDIHVEPNGREQPTIVRFRVDGDCLDFQEIPSTYRNSLVARMKIMAGLDIAERRKPQDGKIRIKLPERTIELRVATLPTVNGNEDMVLRILAASRPLPLEKMALTPANLERLKQAASKPYGLMLCVGPTGSGKTTTLHSVLGYLNTPDRKIWTAEDPVEITQPRLRQVQVSAKIGFTFAAAMRAFLRADPDVIMIGEMRDQETANIAVEASLTGHLVLSTLHTNSAPETITRLVDMGLDPFSFADALIAVLAQRLARGICTVCREAYRPAGHEWKSLAELCTPEFLREVGVSEKDCMLWRGRGCEECRGTGYAGRVALHELLVAGDELKRAIQNKAPAVDLRQAAMAGGMRTLIQDGILKCTQGLTDLAQVLAVCSR
jgi:type II secretory ATPase GspE/PulE/Tfp pilus assembly ATPase PilB-like protein